MFNNLRFSFLFLIVSVKCSSSSQFLFLFKFSKLVIINFFSENFPVNLYPVKDVVFLSKV